MVAWHVAARHPDRIRQLAILDAPHPAVWRRFLLRHPRQAMRSAYIGWFQLPRLPEMLLGARDCALLRRTMRSSARRGLFPRAILDIYAAAWRQPGALTAMLAYYRALRLPGAARVGRIAPQTLILWGGRDSFLDARLAQASAGWCDDGRVALIEPATHWLHLEQPEQVAQALTGFFLS
jgi:pimeloyl-ACP methyl ester carboxylesterase